MMEIAFLVNGFDPEDDLENFDGKEKYSEPEFMWSKLLKLLVANSLF